MNTSVTQHSRSLIKRIKVSLLNTALTYYNGAKPHLSTIFHGPSCIAINSLLYRPFSANTPTYNFTGKKIPAAPSHVLKQFYREKYA